MHEERRDAEEGCWESHYFLEKLTVFAELVLPLCSF